MPGCLSTTVFLPLVGRLGRRAPTGESQSSMSLFCSPIRGSVGSTRNRRHSTICILNDDALLNILYLYRLHIKDEYEDEDGNRMLDWERQRWWYKLVQVSRRWRYLILASRSVLDLHLLCTCGVPVADMLSHSPPLPLTLYYFSDNCEMTAEDEQGALLALSHRDRVRRIALQMPATDLKKIIPAMDRPFPILERLHIRTLTEEDTSLILPTTFQAPNLRRLNLRYTALPIGSPLLTTTGGLAHLWLADISQSTYFPPSYILARLPLMPQLEWLGIGFHSPLPNGDGVRELLDIPIMTHVALPSLRLFSFRGISAYLEALLAQISAPVLGMLDVIFFNQLTFTVPRLLQFIQTSEIFIFNAIELVFKSDSVNLIADPHRGRREWPLDLLIMGKHLGWQVACAIQILGTLSPALSVVEKLTLRHEKHNQSSEWHNQVDRTQWRELLGPFENVKVLHLENELLERLSRSLPSGDEEMPMDILPNLEELTYSGGNISSAYTAFINERKAAGHPVCLESRL
jgi:hypothetical protein